MYKPFRRKQTASLQTERPSRDTKAKSIFCVFLRKFPMVGSYETRLQDKLVEAFRGVGTPE